MAEQLKHFFNQDVAQALADAIFRVFPEFPKRKFVAECVDGLDRLELTQRAHHIKAALRRHLPADFGAASAILVASLDPPIESEELTGMATFRYLPHVFFVAEFGLDHFEHAMQAQYELTQRFTAEFSIRAFLTHHRKATLAKLREWTRDPSPHVRRLVSEGTRPRLPWAPRLPAFQKDPTPVLALLELLKDDPALYVRRSVANNLNDIAKDHPDLAVEICGRWSRGASPERAWIVKHALRSLIKQGHRGALALQGFAGAPKVAIENVRIKPARVKIGATARFECELVSQSRKAQDLLVDFAVHFVKANFKTSPKVFKLTRLKLTAGARAALSGSVSFQEMTTRKHYPGLHRIELLVNGVAMPLGEVKVL